MNLIAKHPYVQAKLPVTRLNNLFYHLFILTICAIAKWKSTEGWSVNVIPVSILLSGRQRITISSVYLASLSDISETLNSLILFVFFVSFSCPICSEVFVLLARFGTVITSVASNLLQGIADVVYPRKFCKFLALIARAKERSLP